MPMRTPDRFPGATEQTAVILTDEGQATTVVGELRNNGGELFGRDSAGEFPLRQAAQAATAAGQLLGSIDGSTFVAITPVTGSHGWLANDRGELLIMEAV